MIEGSDDLARRRDVERVGREERAKRYAQRMGTSVAQHVNVVQQEKKELHNKESRAKYFSEYRKRDRFCPHCGLKVTKLLTKKEKE